MVTINPPHHHSNPHHLAHVIAEMVRRGPPVLSAHFDGEVWHAREGNHRLRAAIALGVIPVLVPVRWGRSRDALARARALVAHAGHRFDRIDVGPTVTA